LQALSQRFKCSAAVFSAASGCQLGCQDVDFEKLVSL
jgi:hypothetical protein